MPPLRLRTFPLCRARRQTQTATPRPAPTRSSVIGNVATVTVFTAFLPTCHLVIDGCYDPHLGSLKFWHAQTGISHVTTDVPVGGQGPQGFHMSDVRFTVFKTCLVHSQMHVDGSTVECPDGMIQNCFFQFRDAGLDLANCQQWQVHGCEFYNFGDGYNVGGDCNQQTAYDISITDANIVAITGCRFNVVAAPNRVNIQINPVATPPGSTLAQRFLIAHNQFGDGSAGTFGISAVRIYATASDIRIGDNHYIGSYSGPVVDDGAGTGAVAAMLGYPTGGGASPSAIVPNTGTTLSSPTLGAGTNPWPKSFSFGHYLPLPSSSPDAPGSWGGWVIFTDPSGSGKLLAYNGSVTRTLANP
jgi:hypothetical protein